MKKRLSQQIPVIFIESLVNTLKTYILAKLEMPHGAKMMVMVIIMMMIGHECTWQTIGGINGREDEWKGC
jgi:hypothetical protein